MKGTITDVDFIPAEFGLSQGHKNGSRPKGIALGGNGSFMTNDGEHTEMRLKIIIDKSGVGVYEDVAKKVKKIMGWEKFSPQRKEKLKKALIGSSVDVEQCEHKRKVHGLKEVLKGL
jgi:hypothetical protein